MRTLNLLLALLALSLVSFPISSPADVPSILNYQGRVDANGKIFNGTGTFRFALVNGDGSATYWSNGVNAVTCPVTNGVFSILLGDTTIPNMAALPASVFENSEVRLRIWFAPQGSALQQLAPDQRVAATAYTLMAANADQLDGADSAAFARLDSSPAFTGTVRMNGFQFGTSATVGRVLTTDANGVGTWQALPASLPPSGPAGGDLTGTYPNPVIAPGAVTGAKIADGSVTAADLAANSVDSTKIVDGSVALADLAGNSVDSTKIADGSVALADLASGSVNSSKIVDGSVAAADLAANSVDSSKIVDGSVALADLAVNSVDGTKIVDGSIAAADLASDAASLAKVSGGAMATASGKVGIGVPAPAYPLTFANVLGDKISLWGNSGAHYGFGIQSNLLQVYSAAATADIAFGYGESTDFTETMRIKGNGNVGIGVASPSARLEIDDKGADPLAIHRASLVLDQGNVASSSSFACGANVYMWQSFTAAIPPGSSGYLGAVEIMIGPHDASTTWTANLRIYEGEGTAGAMLSTQTIGGDAAYRMRLFALPTPVPMTAGSKYTIYFRTYSDCKWRYSADAYPGGISNAAGDYWFRTYQTSTGTDQTSLVVKQGSGNVGIGVADPTYTLHVNGTMAVDNLPQGNRRNVQWDPDTHQFYQAVSSRRYKENITPLADDFQKLLSAEPKTYTMVGDANRREIGFIAEDIDALGLKRLVHYDKDGQPDALKYEKMVLYLVEIAKAQKAEITELRQRLERLEQQRPR